MCVSWPGTCPTRRHKISVHVVFWPVTSNLLEQQIVTNSHVPPSDLRRRKKPGAPNPQVVTSHKQVPQPSKITHSLESGARKKQLCKINSQDINALVLCEFAFVKPTCLVKISAKYHWNSFCLQGTVKLPGASSGLYSADSSVCSTRMRDYHPVSDKHIDSILPRKK